MEDARPDKGEQASSEITDEPHENREVWDDDCEPDGANNDSNSEG